MGTEESNMDYHSPRQSITQRVHTERVIRKIERTRFGMTTRNYHQRQRRQAQYFTVMATVLSVSLLALILA